MHRTSACWLLPVSIAFAELLVISLWFVFTSVPAPLLYIQRELKVRFHVEE